MMTPDGKVSLNKRHKWGSQYDVPPLPCGQSWDQEHDKVQVEPKKKKKKKR